jgi:hypothetical protein
VLQQAFRTSGHAASLSLWCNAKLLKCRVHTTRVQTGFLSEDFFSPVDPKVPNGKHGCLLGTGARCAVDYATTKSLRRKLRLHQVRLEARARDGSRYSCTGNFARTTPAGWPTHRRRARRSFFQLQLEPASSAHTHSNSHLFDRLAPKVPRRPQAWHQNRPWHQSPPRQRPSAREGATAASI